jgi:hypothetical protein
MDKQATLRWKLNLAKITNRLNKFLYQVIISIIMSVRSLFENGGENQPPACHGKVMNLIVVRLTDHLMLSTN